MTFLFPSSSSFILFNDLIISFRLSPFFTHTISIPSSIHLFIGLPRSTYPSISIFSNFLVTCISYLRIICPYHAKRLPHNFCVTDITFRLPLIYLFRIRSSLVTLHSHQAGRHSYLRLNIQINTRQQV